MTLDTAELYSPETNSFELLKMQALHEMPGLAQLTPTRFLIAGGSTNLGVPAYTESEIYDAQTNSFTKVGDLNFLRSGTGLTKLNDGNVLVAGAWYDQNEGHTQAELYDANSQTFSLVGKLNTRRSYNLTLPTVDNQAVILGGIEIKGLPVVETVEVYNPDSKSFTQIQSSLLLNETGWTTTLNQYMRPLETQLTLDNKYLLMAYKVKGKVAEYILFTFDPSTKYSLWPPMVSKKLKVAYILGYASNSDPQQIVLFKLDLATGKLTKSVNSYSFPAGQYTGSMSLSLVNDRSILLTGISNETGVRINFGALDDSYLIEVE